MIVSYLRNVQNIQRNKINEHCKVFYHLSFNFD